MANEHHSDISKVALTNQIAQVFASLIPALVLEDAPEGSTGESARTVCLMCSSSLSFLPESTDYSVLFYFMAGFQTTAAALIFWLKVKIERSPQSTKESLKKILNKSALTLISFLLVMGVVSGVKDTYIVPYLTDDLGASSQLIS